MNIDVATLSGPLQHTIDRIFRARRNMRPSASDYLDLEQSVHSDEEKIAVVAAALDNICAAKPLDTEAEDIFLLGATLRGMLKIETLPRLAYTKIHRRAIRDAFKAGLSGRRFDDA